MAQRAAEQQSAAEHEVDEVGGAGLSGGARQQGAETHNGRWECEESRSQSTRVVYEGEEAMEAEVAAAEHAFAAM